MSPHKKPNLDTGKEKYEPTARDKTAPEAAAPAEPRIKVTEGKKTAMPDDPSGLPMRG